MSKRVSPLVIVLTLSGLFFMIFMIISGFFFLSDSGRVEKNGTKASFFGGAYVGVAELNGLITESRKTIQKLKRLEDDERVKAVVLRLNSPGGITAPSQEIYEAVRQFPKPLVVSMSSLAASGAYYVACGAKKVFANPGTLTGSIGVVMEFANLEKLYDWAKIHRFAVKSGKFKDIGAEFREMTPEERQILQGTVDDVLKQFKEAVVTGRHLKASQVDEVADGRIFTGHQALKLQLVDELGTLNDAVAAAGKLAGIKGKPAVLYIEKKRRHWMEFFDDSSMEESTATSLRSELFSQLVGMALGRSVAPLVSDRVELQPGFHLIWNGY